MFRISVLKYYKNYFEALVREKSKIEAEQNYLISFFPRRSTTACRNFEATVDGPESQYFEPNSTILLTDYPENYEFYYPMANSCKLSAQPINLWGKKTFAKEMVMTRFHPSSGTCSALNIK
jgi:hypothetical protein